MRVMTKRMALALCLPLVMLGSSGATAFGEGTDDRVKQSKSEIDDLSASLVQAEAALTRTNAEVAAARTKASRANEALRRAQRRQHDATTAYELARADEEASSSSLAANRRDQASARRQVGSMARTAFESGGLGDLTFTVEMLTSAKNVSGSMALADVVMRRQQGVITNLESAASAARSETARLAQVRQRASLAKAQQDAAVQSAATAKRDADAAAAKLVALQKTQEQDRARLASEKKKEEAKLAALQAESERTKSVVTGGTQDDSVTHVANEGGFLTAPGPISSIVSGYGWRFHPVLKINKLHEGDDFPFACGTPVYAAGDGTVTEANYNDVSGNHVYISHGTVNGVKLSSAYMHFSQLMVSAGQKVKRGQQIGLSGMTGRVTGCHLHFETRENGVAVDPLKWIK